MSSIDGKYKPRSNDVNEHSPLSILWMSSDYPNNCLFGYHDFHDYFPMETIQKSMTSRMGSVDTDIQPSINVQTLMIFRTMDLIYFIPTIIPRDDDHKLF